MSTSIKSQLAERRASSPERFYLVTDPCGYSELGDIVCGGTIAMLGNVILGMEGPRWGASNPALHSFKRAAIEDAMERLAAKHGGTIPAGLIGEVSEL